MRQARSGAPRLRPVGAGDVFAIPLQTAVYGFGRMLYLKDKWRLAEFFRHFAARPVYSSAIVEAGRIIPVHNVVTLPIESGRWPVIHHDPFFSFDELDTTFFYRGLKGSRRLVTPLGASTAEVVEEEAIAGMSSSMPQFPDYITSLLLEKFEQQADNGRGGNGHGTRS